MKKQKPHQHPEDNVLRQLLRMPPDPKKAKKSPKKR